MKQTTFVFTWFFTWEWLTASAVFRPVYVITIFSKKLIRFVDVFVKYILLQVTCSSFLAAARVRNERGLDRIQALQCMIELVTVCSRIGTQVPYLLSAVASILAQGPRLVPFCYGIFCF